MDTGATSLLRAMTSPETYTFVPGVGYIDLRCAPPINPFGMRGNCYPAPLTTNLTWHTLSPPDGDEVAFQWIERNRLWFRVDPSARRIAFEPDYLSSHGWRYVGPAVNRHG